MKTIEYIEDALEEFLQIFIGDDNTLDWKDHSILSSLSYAIKKNGALTQKQASLLLKILTKYQHLQNLTFDLSNILKNFKWRNDFRKLDMTCSVAVQQDEDGTLWIDMKFPHSLVNQFEEALVNKNQLQHIKWCPTTKNRKLKFYDFNMPTVDNFVRQHNFYIQESFIDALHQVEEIWQQQDNIKPHSVIKDNAVVLVNAIADAADYFQKHFSNDIEKDLFLAKSMGFPAQLEVAPASVVEKISQDPNCHFWMKTNNEFLQLYKSVGEHTVIILDRNTENIIDWLEQFLASAKELDIDTNDFRVCHRESKDGNTQFNNWIKENNLGGDITTGKLFIFKQKPAKWVFTKNIDVKIIGTNSYTPVNEPSTLWWIQSHPCVCYIGEIKPTKTRNRKIVSV